MHPMREGGKYLSLDDIRAWRKTQHEAGLPSDLNDYYKAHDICRRCGGGGTVLTYLGGASQPSGTVTCHVCKGSGRYVNET